MRTRAQQAEAVDVVQKGDVSNDQGDSSAEAEGKAGRGAQDAVDAAGAPVGRHRSCQPRQHLHQAQGAHASAWENPRAQWPVNAPAAAPEINGAT